MNNTSILRYSDILEGFVGFDDWLSSLGIPVRGNDRAHESLRILERAESAFQKGLDGDEAGISKSQYLFGLTEALELHDVYVAFRNHPRQQVRERLVRALSGPALPDAETKNSRDGRNVMFELALGAEWYLQGARVDLLEPDLSIKTPKGQYLLACKRPQHEHGIRAAVRSAASQLRSALAASSEHTVGIIAISLAHVLNRGSSFFSGRYEQLSELLNGLMSVHRDSWRTANIHPRNIAVLFHAHTPANWGEGLFRLSASVVGPPVREGGGYQVLKNDLAQLYSVGFAAWRD